jgi:hypothetical protein
MDTRNLILGFFFILGGLFLIYMSYKWPDKQLKSKTFGGYLIGVIGVIGGLKIIFDAFIEMQL